MENRSKAAFSRELELEPGIPMHFRFSFLANPRAACAAGDRRVASPVESDAYAASMPVSFSPVITL